MEHIKQSLKKIILILLLACLMLTTFCMFGQAIFNVYADTPTNSNVLSDLQRDSNFDIGQYPINNNDGSIKVIQIAESTSKSLILYTYQPCQMTKKLTATSVNMSFTEDVKDTELYFLKLLSTSNVFCKYEVVGVELEESDCRYYNITSIYRPWDEKFDAPSGNDNIINEVAFNVGRLYKASTIDGKVTYSYDKMETIEIINPYTGFLHYSNGFNLYASACRSHYIAFDTDKKIDELMEATVSYVSQKVIHRIGIGGGYEYEEPVTYSNVLIDRKDKGETPANGIFAKKYEWNRIEKSTDFINNKDIDLKDEVKKEIEKTKWVLRFCETAYSYAYSGSTDREEYTKIEQVTILRLKFRTGIKIYDLGTVSNEITGSGETSNNNTNETDPIGWFARMLKKLADLLGIPIWVIYLIIAFLLLGILLPILGLIFPPIGQVLKLVLKAIIKLIEWLLKALIWIIELPFKAIAWIVKKCKGGSAA